MQEPGKCQVARFFQKERFYLMARESTDMKRRVELRIEDHFNADPDPAFYFNTDPLPLFDGPFLGLHFEPPGLHCEPLRPSMALFLSLN